jgi:hypothetical protein
MRERGLIIAGIAPRFGLLFLESVVFAVLCRPENSPANSTSAGRGRHPALDSAELCGRHRRVRSAFSFKPASRSSPALCGLWQPFSCGCNSPRSARSSDAYVATAALILGASLIETSYVLAYHDELTGIRGRRAFNESLLSLDQQYAIAIVDIDHFKKFNDTYGHDVGDQVLCMVAKRLSQVGWRWTGLPLRRRRVRHRLPQHFRQRSVRPSGYAAPDHREIHVSGARF